ncbi:Mu transposase C-terminal domain-containing protein [Desulfopila inferna]|uniref:Mu transposase C-terminal domain-containing protein n=1 Tax=Desulfopila inferna TaxID=468528 RepID=UPI00196318A5|nr:Mu transposase C-terminal domain-containing protein [Desulfopila inferna]MBM9605941.1 transposase [Desulfopila inferna]
MKSAYSSKELAALELPVLPTTANGIARRADRESWSFYWETVRGGSIKMYRAYLLPDAVRQAILDKEEIDTLVPVNGSGNLPATTETTIGAAQGRKANYKAALVKLYMKAMATAAWGKKDQARESFMVGYNSGAAYPDLYKELGALSWKTIEGWKTKLKKTDGNTLQLADRRGKKRGQRSITPLQAQIILAIVRQPKGKSRPKSEIIRIAMDIMKQKGLETLSDATYRRFLNDWIAVNYDEWIWWREGDKGLNDKCLFWTERDYERIEVGDVLVADGHVLNFRVLNPWTGKDQRMMLVLFFDMKSSMPLGWEIMPTENTDSISAALRRSIIRLGKVPKIVYLDNGRAFKGKYFTGTDFEQTELPGLYERLGIQLIVAKPYHGQSKTIERFFKTFGELERLSPSFIGTAIDTKPAHMNRGEKLHRRINKTITQGHVPSLVDSHRAIAVWFDLYASRKQGTNSHLAGQAPQTLFEAGRGPGVDEQALRILMMKKESRKIYGRGVKVFDKGEWYYHPALYGRSHKVSVRFDMQERDSVLVYDQRTDEFICEASRVDKVHPAARILGDQTDIALLENQLEMIGSLRKQTVSHARAMADEVVIPEARRMIEDTGFRIDGPSEPPRLNGGKGNNIKRLPAKPARLSEAERQKAFEEADEAQLFQRELEEAQLHADLEEMNEFDRYGKLLEIEMRGDTLTSEWRRFMRVYEQMPEFERDRDYWESQRAALAVIYRQKNPATDEAAAG